MEQPGVTLIVPIAADLRRNERDIVVCGPNTVRACDEAVRYAHTVPAPRIQLGATEDPHYDNVCMADLMERYMHKLNAGLVFLRHRAPEYNTIGEVLATVDALHALIAQGETVSEVVFLVKDWHAPRVRENVAFIFNRKGVVVPYRILEHYAPPSLWMFAREILARTLNTYRLQRRAHAWT